MAVLAAGAMPAVAAAAGGLPFAWGYNGFGELGNDSTTDAYVPVAVSAGAVPPGTTITEIAAGDSHSLALSSTGAVYAWGTNAEGQLGNTSLTEAHVPVAVSAGAMPAGTTITRIAAAFNHSLALSSTGKLYAWGYNNSGQVGNNSTADAHLPVAVSAGAIPAGTTIVQIAAGDRWSAALSSSGKLYAWGFNAYGQLGNNSTTEAHVPVAVSAGAIPAGTTITQIAAGGNFGLAATSTGKLYAWGYNHEGQLGNSSTTDAHVPVAVSPGAIPAGTTITRIAAAFNHSLALSATGKIFAWGYNYSGQLGTDSTTNALAPVAVSTGAIPAGTVITRIAAGFTKSFALGSTGKLYAWGNNYFGQLGNNSTTDAHAPVAVAAGEIAPGTVTQIASGGSHSLAIAAVGARTTLTVSSSGSGTGTVSGDKISCPPTCSEFATPGSTVTLSAMPAAGSSFAGWSGACTGSGPCTVVMDTDRQVTANWAAAPQQLVDQGATDNGDGMPKPDPACATPSVDVPGVGTLHATCFAYDKASESFSATGHVRFNGLDLEPLDASVPGQIKLTITPKSGQLTVQGDAQLKIGSVVVWKLKQETLTWQLKHVPGAATARVVLSNIEQRVKAKLKDFPLQGDISLDFSQDNGGTISAGIHVALQKPIPDVTGDAHVSLSNANGLNVDSLEFKVPQAKLGPISISDLDVKYDRKNDTWEGSLTATFPVKPRALTVMAHGKLVHGQFDSASASAKGLGITLANPAVFLNDLDLSVSREPKFEGGMGLTAGPELQFGSGKLRLLALHGGFLYDRPGDHPHFKLSGKLVVLSDWGHIEGQIEYWPDTKTLLFGGGFNFPDAGLPFSTFGFSASGGLSGGFSPDGFNVEGNASLKWETHIDIGPVHETVSFEQGATGLASDRGIAICHIGWPNVGLGFTWSSQEFTAFGENCDISPWRSTAVTSLRAAAPLGAHTFTVARGLPFEAFNVVGRDNLPPSVVIEGPHGETARTNADFSPVSGPDFVLMQIPGQSRTFVEIRSPSAGNWTVTPLPGSAAVVDYQQGDPLPEPAVQATVNGSGRNRQLAWRLHSLRGQRVTFVERAQRVDHAIAQTSAARGRRRFSPIPGPGGVRTLVAEVEQDGLPRRTVLVARYRVSAAPKPHRIRGVRLSRKRGALQVRWRPAAYASGYEVRILLSDGRRVLADLPAKRRSFRLTDVDPATGARASVQPLSDVAGNGRPTRARLARVSKRLTLRVPRLARRGHALRFTARPAQTGTLNVELLDSGGNLVRELRLHLRARARRRIALALPGATGDYSILFAYSLDGSSKPDAQTRRLTLR